jgi:tRNA 2-thiouridine synthesizing protein A
MKKRIDARGLSCPQPVILASKAIKEGDFPIEVMVDTVVARENVRRMAENAGYQVSISEAGDEFVLTITK